MRNIYNVNLLIGATFFAVMTTAIYAPKGLAPIFVVAAAGALAIAFAGRSAIDRLGLGAWSLVAFAAFAALSAIWSPLPLESLRTLLAVAGTFIGGALLLCWAASLKFGAGTFIERSIVAGGVVGYSLLAIEIVSDGAILDFLFPVFDKHFVSTALPIILKPGATVGALYLWPFGLSLMRVASRRVAIAAMTAALVVIAMAGSDAAIAAIVIGGAMAAVSLVGKPLGSKLIGFAFSMFILAMPVIAHLAPDPSESGINVTHLSNSALHRLVIWHNTVDRIAEAPIVGHGFDSARMLYGVQSVNRLVLMPDIPDRRFHIFSEPIPLHPHSLVLQIWLELGAVGAILLIAFLWGVVRYIDATIAGPLAHSAAFGALGGIFTVGGIAFGAWQSWWLASVIMVATAIRVAINSPTER